MKLHLVSLLSRWDECFPGLQRHYNHVIILNHQDHNYLLVNKRVLKISAEV